MFSFKKMFVCSGLFLFAVSSFAADDTLFCVKLGYGAKSAYYGAGTNSHHQLVTTQVVANSPDFIQESCVTVHASYSHEQLAYIHDAHDHKILCEITYKSDIWDVIKASITSGTDTCLVSTPKKYAGEMDITVNK